MPLPRRLIPSERLDAAHLVGDHAGVTGESGEAYLDVGRRRAEPPAAGNRFPASVQAVLDADDNGTLLAPVELTLRVVGCGGVETGQCPFFGAGTAEADQCNVGVFDFLPGRRLTARTRAR